MFNNTTWTQKGCVNSTSCTLIQTLHSQKFTKCSVLWLCSSQFHVFELTRQLPRFSMYSLCTEAPPQPRSSVTMQLNDRPQRVGNSVITLSVWERVVSQYCLFACLHATVWINMTSFSSFLFKALEWNCCFFSLSLFFSFFWGEWGGDEVS